MAASRPSRHREHLPRAPVAPGRPGDGIARAGQRHRSASGPAGSRGDARPPAPRREHGRHRPAPACPARPEGRPAGQHLSDRAGGADREPGLDDEGRGGRVRAHPGRADVARLADGHRACWGRHGTQGRQEPAAGARAEEEAEGEAQRVADGRRGEGAHRPQGAAGANRERATCPEAPGRREHPDGGQIHRQRVVRGRPDGHLPRHQPPRAQVARGQADAGGDGTRRRQGSEPHQARGRRARRGIEDVCLDERHQGAQEGGRRLVAQPPHLRARGGPELPGQPVPRQRRSDGARCGEAGHEPRERHRGGRADGPRRHPGLVHRPRRRPPRR